jgi:hypothetical protein
LLSLTDQLKYLAKFSVEKIFLKKMFLRSSKKPCAFLRKIFLWNFWKSVTVPYFVTAAYLLGLYFCRESLTVKVSVQVKIFFCAEISLLKSETVPQSVTVPRCVTVPQV